ncbi:hypothetical protein BHE90_010324 [Fusarium euwallaceae]|uniref:Uncharacterized protein n=4 Tax=Fusarium solani species complex TaxID=232080 RepID=A0A3M2RW87_9HYPO|nr:hypothetical protein CDV36_010832 [Fusarium kuroshium]RSL84984.1 hypothetical protein CEP51_003579 [Fusarium floridanum]RSM07735.1 hypothetical protein CEP52_005045 [Fusarium oligoseptatum]RTE75231.1 hypothetical protein BHE90_010324 [Fusarium euwallaceae]
MSSGPGYNPYTRPIGCGLPARLTYHVDPASTTECQLSTTSVQLPPNTGFDSIKLARPNSLGAQDPVSRRLLQASVSPLRPTRSGLVAADADVSAPNASRISLFSLQWQTRASYS